MIKKLTNFLDSSGCSCVIANGEEIRTFTKRGVADLHHLSKVEPYFLKSAIIADKVVGRGAAAIMAAFGVKELYTHIISKGAYKLLCKHGVEVSYGKMVPHIINRDNTGWCPVELMCKDVDKLEDILVKIDKFIEKNSKSKK